MHYTVAIFKLFISLNIINNKTITKLIFKITFICIAPVFYSGH